MDTSSVTQIYEQLTDHPQTDIHIGDLNATERQELRQISVSGTKGLSQSNAPGRFTDIYYLAGDERAAAELFVDENRALLEQIDFSKTDAVQTSVSRVVYDWILDALGERVLTKYETVVLEERADDTQWVIERQRFDEQPDRRYTTNESKSAVITGTDLRTIYDEHDAEISESALRSHDDIRGNVRWLLEYYRVASGFECDPVSVDGEMAVRKREV